MSRGPIPDKPRLRPSVETVMAMASAYCRKDGNECGGSLHIVLDDGNLSDSDIKYCRDYSTQVGDCDGAAIAGAMLKMTRTQRRRVYTQFRYA